MGKEREGGKNWDEMRVSKVKFKELIEGRITPLASDVSKVARLAAIWANRFGIVGNDSSLAIDANQAARRRPRVESGSVSKVTRSDAEKCPRITCFKDTTGRPSTRILRCNSLVLSRMKSSAFMKFT